MKRLFLLAAFPGAVATILAGSTLVRAQPPGAAGAPAAAAPAACKAFSGGKCCDPTITQHLGKEAVMTACGESDATYLGEKAGKDSCRYVFKSPEGESFVELYKPAQKEVPSSPEDPFFSWKKVGKVFVTDKAKSPKSAPMLAAATGLWMPGQGFFVSINVQSKVCSKSEALKLAKSVR
jgi:hypothetical protein